MDLQSQLTSIDAKNYAIVYMTYMFKFVVLTGLMLLLSCLDNGIITIFKTCNSTQTQTKSRKIYIFNTASVKFECYFGLFCRTHFLEN